MYIYCTNYDNWYKEDDKTTKTLVIDISIIDPVLQNGVSQ